MANRSPGLVQVTTTSTGSGPYTLTNTVPSGTGYRSIADAVADGSLANGDTVHYVIFQNAAPSGKMFERGWGTINTTTLVLTVVSVIERSAALSSGGWGAGTKDVYFAPPGVESVAIVSLANTFLAQQIINLGGTGPSVNANTALSVQKSGIGNDVRLSIIGGNTGNAQLMFGDAAAEFHGRIIYYGSSHPTRPHEMAFHTNNVERVFIDSAGVWRSAAGGKYVRFTTGAVVKMTFNCAPPTGWTRINVTGERLGKYAGAADTPEATGGSWTISGLTFSGNTDGHVLSIAEMPAHTHEINANAGYPVQGGISDSAYHSQTTGLQTFSTGGGGSHSHGISSQAVASSGTWRPAYEIIVKASFD